MKCKCGQRMHHEQTTLAAASLERSRDTFSIISGYSCIMCGSWQDDPLEVKIPMIPEAVKNNDQKINKTMADYIATHRERVAIEFDEITEQRKEKKDWPIIVEWYNAKYDCRLGYSAFRRYYAAVAMNNL